MAVFIRSHMRVQLVDKGRAYEVGGSGRADPQRQQTWTERAASNRNRQGCIKKMKGVVHYMTPQSLDELLRCKARIFSLVK